jgi:hypothetical protein
MMIPDILGGWDLVACLIFSTDLVKIYLVDPYTVGKITASSIFWYEKILMLVPFLEIY